MSDTERQSETANNLSSEYLALLEDLKAYDNPEVFTDPSRPPIYRLSIPSPTGTTPAAITVEINGAHLLTGLRELLFLLIGLAPELKQILTNAGAKDLPELRVKTMADPLWPELESEFFWFFVRHFPELIEKVCAFFAVIATSSLATGKLATTLEESGSEVGQKQRLESEVKKTIETGIKQFRVMLKLMLRTRTRGGKTPNLAPDLRESLHLSYDQFREIAKTIKVHHDSLFKTYSNEHHRITQKEWEEFWIDHAIRVFPERDKAFLELFSTIDRPSASEVSYLWLSRLTNHKQSYVKKLVKELRKSSRISNSADKGTVKTPE